MGSLFFQTACGTQANGQSVTAETRENWIALRDAVTSSARPLTAEERDLVASLVTARRKAMAGGAYVWGRVTDEDGKPLAGVDVEARYELNSTRLPQPNAQFRETSVRTNEAGLYKLRLASPSAALRWRHPGYYIERYSVNNEPRLDAKRAIDSSERGEPDPRLDEFVVGVNVRLLQVGQLTLLDCRKGALTWHNGRPTTRFTYRREDRQGKLHQQKRPGTGFAGIDLQTDEPQQPNAAGRDADSLPVGFYMELSVDASGKPQTEQVMTPFQHVRLEYPKTVRLHAKGTNYGIAPVGDPADTTTHRSTPVLKQAPIDGYTDVIVFSATDVHRWSTDGGPWFYVMANGKYGVARIRSFEQVAVRQSDKPAYRIVIEFEIQPTDGSRNVEMLR